MLPREYFASEDHWIQAIEMEVNLESRLLSVLQWIGDQVPSIGDAHDKADDWDRQSDRLVCSVLYGDPPIENFLDKFRGDAAPPPEKVRPKSDDHLVPPPIEPIRLPAYITTKQMAALLQTTPHGILCRVSRINNGGKNEDGFPMPSGAKRWNREAVLRWLEGKS